MITYPLPSMNVGRTTVITSGGGLNSISIPFLVKDSDPATSGLLSTVRYNSSSQNRVLSLSLTPGDFKTGSRCLTSLSSDASLRWRTSGSRAVSGCEIIKNKT